MLLPAGCGDLVIAGTVSLCNSLEQQRGARGSSEYQEGMTCIAEVAVECSTVATRMPEEGDVDTGGPGRTRVLEAGSCQESVSLGKTQVHCVGYFEMRAIEIEGRGSTLGSCVRRGRNNRARDQTRTSLDARGLCGFNAGSIMHRGPGVRSGGEAVPSDGYAQGRLA